MPRWYGVLPPLMARSFCQFCLHTLMSHTLNQHVLGLESSQSIGLGGILSGMWGKCLMQMVHLKPSLVGWVPGLRRQDAPLESCLQVPGCLLIATGNAGSHDRKSKLLGGGSRSRDQDIPSRSSQWFCMGVSLLPLPGLQPGFLPVLEWKAGFHLGWF